VPYSCHTRAALHVKIVRQAPNPLFATACRVSFVPTSHWPVPAQDEASNTRAANEVPDAAALNAMLARGPEEVAQFTAMDADESLWLPPPQAAAEIPYWLLYDPPSVRAAVIATSKQHPDQVTVRSEAVSRASLWFS